MPQRTTARPPLIELPAVAERLGVNQRYVRRLVADRRIPVIKLGRLFRFEPADIDLIGRAKRP
jgi:excisionase family DNA binding protein